MGRGCLKGVTSSQSSGEQARLAGAKLELMATRMSVAEVGPMAGELRAAC